MSRDEGFDVMDVSTSLPNDPKFRLLSREYPDALGTAFFAYVATMAESWKAGERVTVDVAWPPILPHDDGAVAALLAVKLLDPKRRVTASAWRGFFEQARIRREKSRERWRRANEKRHGETPNPNGEHRAATARSPRGTNAVTAPPIPSDSDRPIPKKNGISSEEDSVARAERADIAALKARGWKRVTKAQRAILDEVLARHDVTGPEFAAATIRATPADKDPLEAVMAADRMWQASQRSKADAEEQAWAEAKAAERAEADRISWLEDPAT